MIQTDGTGALMKRYLWLFGYFMVCLQTFAIEIANLGLIPIDPINNYWIDEERILYIPIFRQNELRVFNLQDLENIHLFDDSNIKRWRIDMIFTPIVNQAEQYLNLSILRENSRIYRGAILGTNKFDLYVVPSDEIEFQKKMSSYSISINDEGIKIYDFDVVPDKITNYLIPWDHFPGIRPRKGDYELIKFQDYSPAKGAVTISYRQTNTTDVEFTHYRAQIIDGKLENIKLMFADDSGKPVYNYSNQMWILNSGLYLTGKYKYHFSYEADSIPYATLIIVDADGNEVYEYEDFEMRMFDEYFYRLSPDRTKILLWGSNLKDDMPGEATYLFEINYDR